jgi:hypothetical protein
MPRTKSKCRNDTAKDKFNSPEFLRAIQRGELPTTPIGALKLKPAAQYLGGLSVPTMHRLVQRGLLKPCRATRHLLFPKKELDRFLMT